MDNYVTQKGAALYEPSKPQKRKESEVNWSQYVGLNFTFRGMPLASVWYIGRWKII